MDALAIFGLQLILSLVVWGLIGKWLLAPWLEKKSLHQSLFWLTLPHASRHIGMVFLGPGIAAQPLPDSFAIPAAYGDLISALLALAALIALRTGRTGALVLVWIFNIVGTVDLMYALSHADAVPGLGAAWYIPTFWVPLLLVTHFMIFVRLIRRES
ncbi:MAG: hypothetical protein V3U99_07535 [Alphaproteobacteria bacterium]